jgi:hypothetical protein
MGLIKKIPQDRYGVSHEKSYSRIGEIYTDYINERIRANVVTYISHEARREGLSPLEIRTYTFNGKDFKSLIEIDGPVTNETIPILNLSNLLRKKVYMKINKHPDFQEGIAIIEETMVEEEISTAVALDNELVLDVDYRIKGINTKELKEEEGINGNGIPLNL